MLELLFYFHTIERHTKIAIWCEINWSIFYYTKLTFQKKIILNAQKSIKYLTFL